MKSACSGVAHNFIDGSKCPVYVDERLLLDVPYKQVNMDFIDTSCHNLFYISHRVVVPYGLHSYSTIASYWFRYTSGLHEIEKNIQDAFFGQQEVRHATSKLRLLANRDLES